MKLVTRKSAWNWELGISEREILNIYCLITQEWIISWVCLVQGNNPNLSSLNFWLLPTRTPAQLLLNVWPTTAKFTIWVVSQSVNYSAVGFLHFISAVPGRKQWFCCGWWHPGALEVTSGSSPSWASRSWFCFPARLLGHGQNQPSTRCCATLWMRGWRFGFTAADLTKCFGNRWG